MEQRRSFGTRVLPHSAGKSKLAASPLRLSATFCGATERAMNVGDIDLAVQLLMPPPVDAVVGDPCGAILLVKCGRCPWQAQRPPPLRTACWGLTSSWGFGRMSVLVSPSGDQSSTESAYRGGN